MELNLDDWQKEVIEYDDDLLIAKGRRIGATFIMGIKAIEYLMKHENTHPSSQIVCVSLTEDQAKLIILFALQHAQEKYKSYIGKGLNKPTQNRIILIVNGNKRILLARPVGNTGDSVRGFEGQILMVDEASRMPPLFWAAAKPILLTTGGKIWMWSTFAGKDGYFWDRFDDAYNKKDPKARFKVWLKDAEEVMYNRPISPSWTEEQREGAKRILEEEKKDMTELEYAQEYLAKPSDDLRQIFPDELVEKCCILSRKQVVSSCPCFLGVDIARLGNDAGTYEIVERRRDFLFHRESIVTRKKYTTETFDKIIELNKLWNFRKIGIDAGAGSLGVGILDFLLRVPGVRKKVVDLNNKKVIIDRDGNKTKLLKEAMYIQLQMLMEQGKIKLLKDIDVQLSLRSVQYEYVRKEGQPTKVKIFSTHHKLSDIVEGLIRAVHLANQKTLNTSIHWM